jgi:hypothetical protein
MHPTATMLLASLDPTLASVRTSSPAGEAAERELTAAREELGGRSP